MLIPDGRDKILLGVMDTGVGIKDQDQAKLFKLFGTISSTKKLNTKGVGLGLSITKMISLAFGGDVAVASKYGTGSIFFSSLAIPGGEDMLADNVEDLEGINTKLQRINS